MIYIHLLYPYLYVLIPILFLYKTNMHEVRIKNLIESIFIITIVYIIIYILLTNIFSIYKSSLVIFNIFIYLYNFKKIIYHSIIKPITKLKKVVFIQWLFTSSILVFTYFSIFYNFDIEIIDLFAKIIFGISLFINIVILFNIIIIKKNIKNSYSEEDPSDNYIKDHNNKFPNIYFIIPDGYPGWEILKEYTNFDNDDFFNFLQNNNFNILKNSFSNYRATSISLPSILNMQYLNKIAEKTDDGSIHYNNLKKVINYNYLYKYLINKNYKVTELLNRWEQGMSFFSKYKKVNTIFINKVSHMFIAKLFDDGLMISYIFKMMEAKKNYNESNNVLGYFSKNKFNDYNNFIMAHMPFPHPPYVIDNKLNFSYIKSIKYGDFSNYQYETEKAENMINQIKYTNNLLKGIVENILKYDKESIIIIQSDHGNHMTRFLGKKNTDNEDYDKTHYNILRAIYYKGEKININSKTAVNTFREIFNILFNDNLDILEEKILVNEPYNNWGGYNKYFYEINIDDL
ncbi:sulfatase-like hydrolase/transferase [Brachyspira hyodysenteriae]|uniref:sulfatase-like hydrolase/transferase n=2 Tax=Brachyspira hyodysenteriae TaxID=159 RepID=UPI000A270DE4|nr:sulfatase-like hydrolase/transferase [Brachyspira hyodysenteriae]